MSLGTMYLVESTANLYCEEKNGQSTRLLLWP